MYEKIKKVLDIFLEIIIILMILSICYWMYDNMFQKPYDDATNHLLTPNRYWESVKCEGNNCTIIFDSNVSYVSGIAMTESMAPVVNGGDVIICLNTTPRPGDIVSVGNILHTVYKIEDDWLTTKGQNNPTLDNFKFPISQIDCVVSTVIR